MGVIKFIPSEDLTYPVTDFLPISNWRILGVMRGDRLEVVIARFHRFIIHNITLKEFHALNENKATKECTYRYINNALSCPACDGKGRVDWIQKTRTLPRKFSPHRDYSYRYYRRNTNPSSIKRLKPHDNLIEMYGSCPKVSDGFEICGKCLGTGVHRFNPSIQHSISAYVLSGGDIKYHYPEETDDNTSK